MSKTIEVTLQDIAPNLSATEVKLYTTATDGDCDTDRGTQHCVDYEITGCKVIMNKVDISDMPIGKFIMDHMDEMQILEDNL